MANSAGCATWPRPNFLICSNEGSDDCDRLGRDCLPATSSWQRWECVRDADVGGEWAVGGAGDVSAGVPITMLYSDPVRVGPQANDDKIEACFCISSAFSRGGRGPGPWLTPLRWSGGVNLQQLRRRSGHDGEGAGMALPLWQCNGPISRRKDPDQASGSGREKSSEKRLLGVRLPAPVWAEGAPVASKAGRRNTKSPVDQLSSHCSVCSTRAPISKATIRP